MNPTRFPTAKADLKGRKSPRSPSPKALSLVRKSLLLNLGIVVTVLPVLVFAGGAKALPPTLAILTTISVLIWTATFATASFLSVSRIFEAQRTQVTRQTHRDPGTELGIVDEWMDAPL